MNRSNFLALTGTFTGGKLLLPDFLYTFSKQNAIVNPNECLVFLQLNGGNDGLNTFIPFENELYYKARPTIALSKSEIISANNGMAFHPSFNDFARIQQNGDLTVVQNVGYQNPVRSHFRSQEIWQTAPQRQEYLTSGWLGRFLDIHCKEHTPTAGINMDTYDNLAFLGNVPNSLTINDPRRFSSIDLAESKLMASTNPQLDFVRKVANSISEGAAEIQKAIAKTKDNDFLYPKSELAGRLKWISKLIKGNLNSNVYYSSMNGFDTHEGQKGTHATKLLEVNNAVGAFYDDLKEAKLLENVTLVVFSEFGRRVAENGGGTDHGTAAPMFIIGGNNKGKVIGNNPNLQDLDEGDLKYEIDFRSVYASLLNAKMNFNATKIGIINKPLNGIF
jgi:uncharacterized protein (DUF1501 family)